MSAIFLHSDKPPAAQVSGWMMSIARDDEEIAEAEARELAFAARDRESKAPAFTARYPAISSGGTGSSNQPMS